MILLDKRYIGSCDNGVPPSITIHNTTLDISSPDYRRGSTRTVSYSDVKHVYASNDTLVIKIMRTELSLPGFDPQECADLARIIEIGRKDPLLSSKEFQRYKTEARKREEKAARKEEKREERAEKRAEKIASRKAMVNSLVDGINRYREESRIREDRERQNQISEENREMERKERRENRIDAQLIGPDDSEEIIYQKLSKLDKMFQKQLNDFDDELVTRILQTYEDNLEILEDRFPNQKITAHASERLESIRQRKQDYHKTARKKSILTFILLILVIGAFFLLDKFDIFSFISPYRLKP